MADPMRQLVEAIVATAEVVGDEIRPAAAALMAEDLANYPAAAVGKALTACRRELKGRLSLAAILERIDDGHPSPNEAWARVMPAADERNTVVWTSEMERAWSAALPLVLAGDKIAARQAFLEVYPRLLKEARNEFRPAAYYPSLGFDQHGRQAAIKEAAARGLLTQEAAGNYLRIEGPAAVFNPVALLRGRVEVSPTAGPEVVERLEKLKRVLAGDDGKDPA